MFRYLQYLLVVWIVINILCKQYNIEACNTDHKCFSSLYLVSDKNLQTFTNIIIYLNITFLINENTILPVLVDTSKWINNIETF